MTEKIKDELLEQKRRLMADIEELEQLDPSKDDFRDINNTDDDDAAESEDHSRIQARIATAQSQLQTTIKALDKLEAGTYGLCERCGKPIAKERLAAKPSAIYDIACEEIIESGRQ
jgi:RNA polymerase-binding transcription factor DksA